MCSSDLKVCVVCTDRRTDAERCESGKGGAEVGARGDEGGRLLTHGRQGGRRQGGESQMGSGSGDIVGRFGVGEDLDEGRLGDGDTQSDIK